MGYERAKIYKLVCEDGYYYFGSTINELRSRFCGHKQASQKQPYRVYQHINEIGWDKVRIELVELYPCSNRKELNKKENEYIRRHKSDLLCLNNNFAHLTAEEKVEYKRNHAEKNKQKLAEYHKQKRTGNPDVVAYQQNYRKQNKEAIQNSKRQYYLEHKDECDRKNKERYFRNREKILERKKQKYHQDRNQTTT